MLCPTSRLQVLGLTGNLLLGDCTSQRSWGPTRCFPSLVLCDAHPSPPAQASHVARHGQSHSGSGPMCLGVCASQMPKSAKAICCLGKDIVHWEHHCSEPTEAAAGAGTCHSRDLRWDLCTCRPRQRNWLDPSGSPGSPQFSGPHIPQPLAPKGAVF